MPSFFSMFSATIEVVSCSDFCPVCLRNTFRFSWIGDGMVRSYCWKCGGHAESRECRCPGGAHIYARPDRTYGQVPGSVGWFVLFVVFVGVVTLVALGC